MISSDTAQAIVEAFFTALLTVVLMYGMRSLFVWTWGEYATAWMCVFIVTLLRRSQ